MYYGLDLHKEFIQVSAVDNAGKEVKNWKIPTSFESISEFGEILNKSDAVVMETTFNTWAVYSILKESKCSRVVVANSLQVKAIAQARVKTDKLDARILAQLLRADFIPEVQPPDQKTRELRQLVAHRKMMGKHRVSFVNGIRAIFNKKLIKHPKALFGPEGRKWLKSQKLDSTEKLIVQNYLHMFDETEARMKEIDERMIEHAKVEEDVRLLMSIPGVGLTSAMGICSAIGDIDRFKTPEQLASYFGLVPTISQSAEKSYMGRITKAGTKTGRWLAIEAAQAMAISGAPLTATYYRIRRKKNHNIAVTAVARKLIVLSWHMLKKREPYRYTIPTRQTKEKLRRVTAGFKQARKGQAPVSIEDVYEEVKLPQPTEPNAAEKRVLAKNRRTITQGKQHFGFDQINSRPKSRKIPST